MKDTNKEVEHLFIEMLMKKSGQERMKLGFSMFQLARKQVIESIKMLKPNIENAELRKLIFLRFYDQDFSLKKQAKILKNI